MGCLKFHVVYRDTTIRPQNIKRLLSLVNDSFVVTYSEGRLSLMGYKEK